MDKIFTYCIINSRGEYKVLLWNLKIAVILHHPCIDYIRPRAPVKAIKVFLFKGPGYFNGSVASKIEKDNRIAIKNRTKNKVATIIALGCGGGVDVETLKRITEVVLLMDNVTPDQITQFFQWVSSSVSTASVSAQRAGVGEAQAELPEVPKGIQVVL